MAKVVVHDAAIREVKKLLDAEVGKIADAILADAQAIVPVKTGRLKRSGFAEGDGNGNWQVGFDVPYADTVELGGGGRPPKPYLLPAASKKR